MEDRICPFDTENIGQFDKFTSYFQPSGEHLVKIAWVLVEFKFQTMFFSAALHEYLVFDKACLKFKRYTFTVFEHYWESATFRSREIL